MAEKILICGVNWIGDTIMSMPAVQRFRAQHPKVEITLLVKPFLEPLWRMNGSADTIQTLDKTKLNLPTAGILKDNNFDAAFIFPNSFRSGFIPFVARIPRRVGFSGHWRRPMLTHTIPPPEGHQKHEYEAILGTEGPLPPPKIEVPRTEQDWAMQEIENLPKGRRIVFLPGAARGPAKRWPEEHFVKLGRLLSQQDYSVIISGGEGDTLAGARIASKIGTKALNLTGKTDLLQWAALLREVDLVVCNDSGGMHLAAALGTSLIAIYGTTDPKKTGPLSDKATVVQNAKRTSRALKPNSKRAVQALATINPETIYLKISEIMP